MNGTAFPKAKVVLDNNFFAVLMSNGLVEGNGPAGLSVYFMAFNWQDDPLGGWALSEHEAMPELLGFLLERRAFHFAHICWLREGLDPRWDTVVFHLPCGVKLCLGFLPESSKPGQHLLSLPLAFPSQAGIYEVWHCHKQIWLGFRVLMVGHVEISATPF